MRRLLVATAAILALWAVPAFAKTIEYRDEGRCCDYRGGKRIVVDACRPCAVPTATQAVPTRTPAPTPPPLPCEGLGNKTLEVGKPRLMCFDVGTAWAGTIEIKTVNLGNASCGYVWMTATSPSGQSYDSGGAQPGAVFIPREVGKYYVWVELKWGCNRYNFNWQ